MENPLISEASCKIPTSKSSNTPPSPQLQHLHNDTLSLSDEAIPSSSASNSISLEAKGKNDTWSLELLSLLASTIILGALVYILHRFDGSPMTEWTLHLTSNTCVSIAIRLVEVLTGVAICSGLGQLKWIKYRQRSRSLAEMQRFNDASRKSLAGSLAVGVGHGKWVDSSCHLDCELIS